MIKTKNILCKLFIFFVFNCSFILNDTKKEDLSKYNINFIENICEDFTDKQCIFYCEGIIKETKEALEEFITRNINKDSLFFTSEAYYYKGLYEFYGLNENNAPNLELGLEHFIIASYLKNEKANYRLFLLYDTDLIFHIIYTKKFKNILQTDKILNLIQNTDFWNNFNIFYKFPNNNSKNETIRRNLQKSIGHNFLYLSTLKKYSPAMIVLGLKYLNGIGVEQNCNTSIEYIKEVAYNEVVPRVNNEGLYGPMSFTTFKIENYEHIEKMYKKQYQISELDELIQFYNIQKDKNIKQAKNILKEIVLRYFYGITVKKDYNESKKWLEICIKYHSGFCYAYLGEIYLHGYGSTEKNYEMAYNCFNKSVLNGEKSLGYAGLGYMSYYGFYLKQDKNKAYDYFLEGIKQADSANSLSYSSLFYNMITLLIEDEPENHRFTDLLKDPILKSIYMNLHVINPNNKREINEEIKKIIDTRMKENKISAPKDFELAYKYANLLTLNSKTYGTYILSMMNNYNIKSKLDSCQENVKILLRTALANNEFINRMKLSKKLYKEKKYKSMFLISVEMTYEGSYDALANVISLLNKRKIFNDNNYQRYITYYFIEFMLKNEIYNLFALFNSAEFFYSNKIYDKAIELYKLLINHSGGNEDNFYVANGFYYLGMMSNFGWGTKKNITKANYFFQKSLYYDKISEYPIKIIQILNKISSLFDFSIENKEDINDNLSIIKIFKNFTKYLTKFNLLSVSFTTLISFYIWFYYNLNNQDSKSL